PKHIKVVLTTSSGTFTATLSNDGPVVAPSVGCPEARILRRSKISQLLDAQPKKRFEALKAFIAVPGIDKSEEALRTIARTTADNYNEAVRAYTQAQDELQKLWTAESEPGKSALEWAATESAKDLTALEATVTAINSISSKFQDTDVSLSSFDGATTALTTARTTLSAVETAQQKVEAKQLQGTASLLALLQNAKKYIASHTGLPSCPVCEQTVKSTDLISSLDKRISGMNELSDAASKVTTARQTLHSKESIATKLREDFCRKAKDVGLLLKTSSLKEVTDLNIQWKDYELVLTHEVATLELEKKARELWDAMLPCRSLLAARKQTDQTSINQRNAIKGHHDTHAEKLKTAKSLEGLSKTLNGALEIVSHQRKAYVEGVLATISDEVEQLYAKLHPDEGIGKVRFHLKPNAIGSLEFDGQFQNRSDIPPQAYYSESHLDTLGICVFLALAKHFMTENTIVVLDDVLTSVDAPHLDRFIQLLHEQAPHFKQVIVSTHYRPWKDRYRNARGPAAKTQMIELRPWTLQGGVQSDEAVTAITELRAALAADKMDRQVVAAKAGIQLESILDFITFH
ncbi:MAG: hypothetical protein WBX38_15370, partial [Candidatus Sulfotelmatobacter sp.]